MTAKNNKLTIAGSSTPALPKAMKDRLMNKLMDRNDDKIIDLMTQRKAHMDAIKRIDGEIKSLTTIDGME